MSSNSSEHIADIGIDLQIAAKSLEQGGIIGIPTETVYGLAANAFNEAAVLKVFAAKNRPSFDPLITHIAKGADLENLVEHIPEKAQKLIDKFWPGPLTLVLKKKPIISDLISSGLPTAAFRMPSHPLLQELLQRIEFPLVAPSANPFGYVSPTSAQHVASQLGEKIDYILDGGPSKIGLESTIISFEKDIPQILRLGGLSVEEIKGVIGDVAVAISSTSKPSAPGMLSSHYAPKKKVILGDLETLIRLHAREKKGVLSFKENYPSYVNFVLSESGSVNEAATKLFSALRWFESQNVDVILAELVPDRGLGRAINDRLKRASYK
jgi:L-threonylcarbamoyladenylate synthase